MLKVFKKARKQVTFDLNTNELKSEFGKGNYTRGYRLLKYFFTRRGFSRIQGSVYNSNDKISKPSIVFLLLDLKKEEPWIRKCLKKISVTNIRGVNNFERFLKL